MSGPDRRLSRRQLALGGRFEGHASSPFTSRFVVFAGAGRNGFVEFAQFSRWTGSEQEASRQVRIFQKTIMAADVRTTPMPNSVDFAAFGTGTAFTN